MVPMHDKDDLKSMPIDLENIYKYQKDKKCLKDLLKKDKIFQYKTFYRAGTLGMTGRLEWELLCFDKELLRRLELLPYKAVNSFLSTCFSK